MTAIFAHFSICKKLFNIYSKPTKEGGGEGTVDCFGPFNAVSEVQLFLIEKYNFRFVFSPLWLLLNLCYFHLLDILNSVNFKSKSINTEAESKGYLNHTAWIVEKPYIYMHLPPLVMLCANYYINGNLI